MMMMKPKGHYLRDQIPYYSHFKPKAFTLTIGKTVILQSTVLLGKYMEQINEDDEENDDDNLPIFPPMDEFVTKITIAVTKSIGNTTTLRTLEAIALRFMDVQSAGKLMKSKRFNIVQNSTTCIHK